MKNYTTQTASLKATTIDTRALNAKRIDTKKLFIEGSTLEEVILQTSPKSINNAVKISTTIGSIMNNQVLFGELGLKIWNNSSGENYILDIYCDSTKYTPVQVMINGRVIHLNLTPYVEGWDGEIWKANDNLFEIYGGISDSTMIEVLMIVHEQQDGDEPVQTSLTGNVQHNVVYHLGEEVTLNLSLPSNLVANYAAEVVFTSGATPTTLTSDSRIKWVGDDVNGGVFTPVANVRYSCSLQYDGVFVRGMTFGIPTV